MPLRQIAENAGQDGAVVAGEVLRNDTYAWGYDAQAGEYKDLVAAGVIDPTKVVRTALQGAASVAALLITTAHPSPPSRPRHSESARSQSDKRFFRDLLNRSLHRG